MTTEEALSEVEDAASRAPTGELHEAWRVLKAAIADATAELERVRNVGSRMNYELLEANGKLADATARAERAEASLLDCRHTLTRSIYLDDESEDAPADETLEFLRRDPGKACTGGMEWRRWADAIVKAFPTVAEAANLDAPATGEGE